MKKNSDFLIWVARVKVLEDSTARVELPKMMKLPDISLVLPFQSVHTKRGFQLAMASRIVFVVAYWSRTSIHA